MCDPILRLGLVCLVGLARQHVHAVRLSVSPADGAYVDQDELSNVSVAARDIAAAAQLGVGRAL